MKINPCKCEDRETCFSYNEMVEAEDKRVQAEERE